jgi:hypothetical protein
MTNTLLVAAIAVIFVQQEMGCVQVKLWTVVAILLPQGVQADGEVDTGDSGVWDTEN